jgi:hypothetical protein
MNIKDKIKKILADAFDVAPVVTPAAPAAPVAAVPVPYTLSDGTAILITQAGQVPAVGDTVTNADGSPVAAGDLVFEDGSTVTVDASGTITAVGAASPVTTDLAGAPPVPTLEERVAAIENAIQKALQPAQTAAPKFEITEEAFNAMKTENANLKKAIEGFGELLGVIGETPTAEPVTLTESQKAKFERDKAKKEKENELEAKRTRMAENLGKLRKNKELV